MLLSAAVRGSYSTCSRVDSIVYLHVSLTISVQLLIIRIKFLLSSLRFIYFRFSQLFLFCLYFVLVSVRYRSICMMRGSLWMSSLLGAPCLHLWGAVHRMRSDLYDVRQS